MKGLASGGFAFITRVGSAYPPTTFISRCVFRKLSAPFEFTVLPKLISYKVFKLLPFSPKPISLWFQHNRSRKLPILAVTVASPPSPPAPGIVPKRKRIPGEMKYYAVRKGYNPGIYTTWKECLGQVTGFKGATCKCALAACYIGSL